MSVNQPQLPSNMLDALQIFANTAWHNPLAFQRTHRSSTSRDVAYLHLQDHSVALQYLFGSALAEYHQILVRDEYREALRALETDSTYKRGAYIIGQPGVGKTCFLVYVLIERLRDHKPVAVQLRASDPFYAVFTHTCTLYTLSDPSPLVQRDVWALSDLRASTSTPLDIFLDISSKVVQATPPSAYWKGWSRQRGAQMFVMNVWSEEEIADISSLLELDVEHMTALAAKWGGVPRTLLEQSVKDESQRDWELCRAAACAVESYTTLPMLDTQDVDTTSVVFFVVPLKDRMGNICRNRYVIRVPTQTLQSALAIAVQKTESKVRVDFFHLIGGHPTTQYCARNIYVNWFHSRMTSGRAPHQSWLNNYHYSEHRQLLVQAIVTKDISVVRDAAKFLETPGNWATPYYWIPPHGEFLGVDCIVFFKAIVFVIQVTTSFRPSLTESPQVGLDKLKNFLPLERQSKLRWMFMFVGISAELVDTALAYWDLGGASTGPCVFDPDGTPYKVYSEEEGE